MTDGGRMATGDDRYITRTELEAPGIKHMLHNSSVKAIRMLNKLRQQASLQALTHNSVRIDCCLLSPLFDSAPWGSLTISRAN